MTRFILAATFAMLVTVNVTIAQSSTANEAVEDNSLTLPVLSLRSVELKEGVDAASFEAFVRDEFKPAFSKPTHGIRAFIVKGDRGKGKGAYQIVVIFDSQEVRNKYFPVEGGDADESLRNDATPTQISALLKLSSLVSVGDYTDFAAIGE